MGFVFTVESESGFVFNDRRYRHSAYSALSSSIPTILLLSSEEQNIRQLRHQERSIQWEAPAPTAVDNAEKMGIISRIPPSSLQIR
jgi:hypothetical protein